jgi:hypothetical protein
MLCDRCNAPITPPAGTVFTPDVFRQIVRRGFGPSFEAMITPVMMGTEEQYVRGWKSDLVERSTTPWLLCPSCAAQAREFLIEPSKPAPQHRVSKGARLAALVLALVIVAAGAVLVLPTMGLKLPVFPLNRGLVTATTSEAVSRQTTDIPVTEGPGAAAVLSQATDTVTPTPGPSATRAATVTASLVRAVVTTSALNVRTGPGTNYPKTGALRKGDQAVVTGRTETGDWLAVTLADGKKGWVAASLVKLDVPVSGIAVAQDIPKPPTPAATSKPALPRATLTVDEQIAAVAKGTHGALPQPGDMGGVSAGGEAEVTIVNDTPHVLTVLIGSPSSTSITIEACSSCKHYSLAGPSNCQEEGRTKRTIRLKPGSSQVVARADDRSVTPFLGAWELKPDAAYFSCFYIVVR